MVKFIEWLEEIGMLEYITDAAKIIAAAMAVILYGAWVLAGALVGILIVILVFAESAWWLLGFILWLVLAVITVAVGMLMWDKL